MAYTAWSVVYGEQPTAAKWNQLGQNDAGFRDGTNIDNNAIINRHILDGEITPAKLSSAANWYEEIGRATLGSAADSLTLSGLPARKYLRILILALQAGSIDTSIQFNGDTGNNYAWNISTDGGANGKTASTNIVPGQTSGTANQWLVFDVTNLANQAKSVIGNVMNDGADAASTAPVRREVSAKWHNKSVQISSVRLFNSAGGDFAAGTEIVVLGHD